MTMYYTADKVSYSTMTELLAASGATGIRADALDHPGSDMYYDSSVSKWGGNLGSGWTVAGLPTTVALGTRALCTSNSLEYIYTSTGWQQQPARPTITPQNMSRVRWWDADGSLLKEEWVAAGNTGTAPANPSLSANLTFNGWAGISGGTGDRDLVACYSPTDGYTWINVYVDNVSGLDVSLLLNKSDGSTLSVYWGDGALSQPTNSGNFTTAHTYAAEGYYSIRIAITSGSGTYNFGYSSLNNGLMGYASKCKSVWIADSILSINNYAFANNAGIQYVTGQYVNTVGNYAFSDAANLMCVSLPNATSINTYAFYNCFRFMFASFPSATTVGTYAFRYCYGMLTAYLPSVTSFGTFAMDNCTQLTSLVLTSCTTLTANCLSYTYTLRYLYLTAVTAVNGYALDFSGVQQLWLPNTSLATIAARAFSFTKRMQGLHLSATTPPTMADSNALLGWAGSFTGQKIYVPSGSITIYQGATNWSTYASWITGA